MRFTKGIWPSLIGVPLLVIEAPYNVFLANSENQLTVGNLATSAICTVQAGNVRALVNVRNVSTSGQNIRVGQNPSFSAPVTGLLLRPGESFEWRDINITISAIADAAGALLDRMQFWSTF